MGRRRELALLDGQAEAVSRADGLGACLTASRAALVGARIEREPGDAGRAQAALEETTVRAAALPLEGTALDQHVAEALAGGRG